MHACLQVMVEQLRPEAMRHEVSLEADLPQVAFRRLRKVHGAAGHGRTELHGKGRGMAPSGRRDVGGIVGGTPWPCAMAAGARTTPFMPLVP